MDQEGIRRVERTAMIDPGVLLTELTPPGGRQFWLEEGMLPQDRLGNIKPTFKIGEVAKVFFARSPDWLRWLSTQNEQGGGIFELGGQPLTVRRTTSEARIYTLVDVERLAHALLEHGRIDMQQFTSAINIIRWMAYCYKILKPQDMIPSHDAVGVEQLPIEGIDEQIAAVRLHNQQQREQDQAGTCQSCREDRHGDCDTAVEIARRTFKGETLIKVDDPCRCYTGNPKIHE